jgi:hypothetical protein
MKDEMILLVSLARSHRQTFSTRWREDQNHSRRKLTAKDVVRRILAIHYRPEQGTTGP